MPELSGPARILSHAKRRIWATERTRVDAAKQAVGKDLLETKKKAWRNQPSPGRITDGLGAAIRWLGDSFDRSVPGDAIRWGTLNAQGTGGKGLGSLESLDGHWGPLDKLLNEFYGVHGHVLIVTDPGCSVEGLSMLVRRSVVAGDSGTAVAPGIGGGPGGGRLPDVESPEGSGSPQGPESRAGAGKGAGAD